MKRHDKNRVLLIGLDAAESSLIERWMEEGALPTFRAFKETGAYGPLASSAEWLVGSPWPTFYTGTSPAEHGLYHYLVWRPERMAAERPSMDWMPLRPFWRDLGARGRRVVAIDIPLAYAPEPFDGVEICGWATHELLEPPASHPPNLIEQVRQRFDVAPFDNEQTYRLSAGEQLGVRDQCIRTTELVGELGRAFMQEHPWDLFMICFTATHRGGHQLWDLTSTTGQPTADQKSALETALRQVYIACDRAIGRLIDEAGPDTTTLVYSLHGMGPNASRCDLLAEMLARVLADRDHTDRPLQGGGYAQHLRTLLPIRLRSWVKNRLPFAMQDRLTLLWRTGGIDWHNTRAFAAFSDLYGYVRINLNGREAAGIVEPGTEYQELCAEIIEGLKSFVDEDTGQPIVDRVGQVDALYPEGRMRRHLPDLMIGWITSPAARHRRIVSPRFGAIDWPTPGYHPQGRSGNHRPSGFLFASGDGIAPGTTIEQAGILDLAPTVLQMLGLSAPPEFQGRSLF